MGSTTDLRQNKSHQNIYVKKQDVSRIEQL